MRAQFVAAFDAINTRKFTTRESELKRWIELNQSFNDLNSLDQSIKMSFFFSGGFKSWHLLCKDMVYYLESTTGEDVDDTNTCRTRTDGRIAVETDLDFNLAILSAELPNSDTIRGTNLSGTEYFNSILLRDFRIPENKHLDHYHIQVNE